MRAWKKAPGKKEWSANTTKIRAEIYEDGAGKFYWKAYEYKPPHHSQSGVEDQLSWAKGAAEIFFKDHKGHTPWTA